MSKKKTDEQTKTVRPVYTQKEMNLLGTLIKGAKPKGQEYKIEGRMTIARINEVIESAAAPGFIALDSVGWKRWANGELKLDGKQDVYLSFPKAPAKPKVEEAPKMKLSGEKSASTAKQKTA